MSKDNFSPKGINFRSDINLPVKSLVISLKHVVSFLRKISDSEKLVRYNDWWQHDGLHFNKGKTDFTSLNSIIETPETVYENMPGDFRVFIGISDINITWYLRFYVDLNKDEDEDFLEGRFDITIPYELENDFTSNVLSHLPILLIKQDAQEYYDSIILKE